MPSGEVSDAVITIRPAWAGDEAGIIELIVPIQSGEFGFSITAADQPDLGDIDGFYRQGPGEFWWRTMAAGSSARSR